MALNGLNLVNLLYGDSLHKRYTLALCEEEIHKLYILLLGNMWNNTVLAKCTSDVR